MIVIGCDPGTTESALVVLAGNKGDEPVILRAMHEANDEVLVTLATWVDKPGAVLILEKIESYGMAVGETTFQTVFWSGRFAQAWRPGRFEQLGRRIVKQHICHTARATDANIRQALIDRFGGDGAIGTKKAPGPLYGLKGHLWAAFAVAITWFDQHHQDGETIRPGVCAEF